MSEELTRREQILKDMGIQALELAIEQKRNEIRQANINLESMVDRLNALKGLTNMKIRLTKSLSWNLGTFIQNVGLTLISFYILVLLVQSIIVFHNHVGGL